MLLTTVPFAASITVAFLLRPLNVKTRCEAASYRIASGFLASSGSLIFDVSFNVFRSNTVTVFSPPILCKAFTTNGGDNTVQAMDMKASEEATRVYTCDETKKTAAIMD